MSISVLVVDDEIEITELIGGHLRSQGYDVATSNDPREALLLVKGQNYHVVIADTDMPGMSGVDLLKETKNLNGMIHVIMITGKISMNGVLDCMRRGADTCIFKPIVDLELVSRAVERASANIDHWQEILRALQTTDFGIEEAAAPQAA